MSIQDDIEEVSLQLAGYDPDELEPWNRIVKVLNRIAGTRWEDWPTEHCPGCGRDVLIGREESHKRFCIANEPPQRNQK